MSQFFFNQQEIKAVEVLKKMGKEHALEALKSMLLIRHFETRGEASYRQGFVGGFYHSYAGQEAIQVAAVQVFGQKHWYATTYRCHALALLLGATPNELMAELFGRATGNAKGRGGSMHLYAQRLLGGFAIVGGHLPIAAGAAFSSKYLNKNELSICFLGDGAVAQGSFHETLNLATLWNLPVIFVIENNQWGMGTHVSRAICTDGMARFQAPSYGIDGYTIDGMDYFSCYAGFAHVYQQAMAEQRPILVECVCQRFRGHSISDPGLYRTKEALNEILQSDPIPYLAAFLQQQGGLSEQAYQDLDKWARELILEAVEFAKNSPWPSVATLGEEVYAP